jgi:hypothetical protein
MLVRGKDSNRLVRVFNIALVIALIKGVRQVIINFKE